MTQTVIIELNDAASIPETTATQLKSLVDHLSNGTQSVKFRVEIETEDPLALSFAGDELQEIGEDDSDASTDTDHSESEKPPRLNPDTRRWTLASLLYHADEPLPVSTIVSVSEDHEWEMSQAQASAELYGMFQDDLVDRTGSPYEYALTEFGNSRLETRTNEEAAELKPNPF